MSQHNRTNDCIINKLKRCVVKLGSLENRRVKQEDWTETLKYDTYFAELLLKPTKNSSRSKSMKSNLSMESWNKIPRFKQSYWEKLIVAFEQSLVGFRSTSDLVIVLPWNWALAFLFFLQKAGWAYTQCVHILRHSSSATSTITPPSDLLWADGAPSWLHEIEPPHIKTQALKEETLLFI